MTLQAEFEQAAVRAKALPRRPSDENLLKLYALYKQVMEGDVKGDEPGMFDFVGRAKYDAWARLRGKARDEAMQAYIDLVKSLQAG
jgi:diazepam-binding inhibitor (GABA receptor modulating acyl-CoA-binding protein)